MPNARQIARNSLYNVLGGALPLPVAIVTIPVVVHGLGPAAFGVLGIYWMFLAVIEDVGFARAGTRFLALVRPDAGAAVRRVVGVTVVAQVLVGLVLGATLVAVANPLTTRVLDVANTELRFQAAAGLLILAATCPVLTLSAALRGFLEAVQRFAVLNKIRVAGDSLNHALPAAAVLLGFGVREIMVLLFAQRVAVAGACAWACRDILLTKSDGAEPRGARAPRQTPSGPSVMDILGFGLWSTVSNTLSPILAYLDRFLLGALVGVTAVGVYTAPYDAVTQVLLVPWGIEAVLFPTISTLHGQDLYGELRRVRRRATAAVLAIVAPLVLACAILAGPGLRLWLGPAATMESVRAVQVLALGVLAAAMARVPFATLQGLGRADVTGKIQLIELPIQVLVAWWMVLRWGVVGAAGAWTFRVTLDSALLHFAAARLVPRMRPRGGGAAR